MTTTTETATTRTCPPSAVADQILPWGDVKARDLVLWDGDMRPVEATQPYGPLDIGERTVEFADEPGALYIPHGTYTAVRRYTEGISERDALVIAALDEAAGDRENRASTTCTNCTYMGDGPCPGQREHLERAAAYRAERDRREAGR